MASAAIRKTASVLGVSILIDTPVVTDGAVVKDPVLPAAKVGALTTRTDQNTGVLTMAAGHGIGTGNRLDVYWDGGMRIGMVVGTVSGNSVPVDLGSGDDFPGAATAITAMVPKLETFPVPDTGALEALLIACQAKATVVFRDDVPAVAATIRTVGGIKGSALDGHIWDSTDGSTNPLVSKALIADVYLSHGDSTAARQVSVVALIN